MASAIPSALRNEIEQRTGSVIVKEKKRGGGGASRQGAEVQLRWQTGEDQLCYLAWDARAGDPSRLPYFERETAILAALSGPWRESGIKVAPLIASFPSHLALLSEFIGGNDRFADADDKNLLAQEFVGQIVKLHGLDANDAVFATLGNGEEPPSVRIRANIEQWSADNRAKLGEPVFALALDWLARNVPADNGPAVVLHGDAGPGNFLFEDNQISALVDWELTHLGDPMEDLAQIWVRSLIQPFVPMQDVFAAYSKASGQSVDIDRVKFYRLYFQLSFSVPSSVLAKAKGSAAGATGTALMFSTMHKRVIVRSLAELEGVGLFEPVLPVCEPDLTDPSFATALADLKNDIVPASGNQRASAKAKELARLVKFWRMRARYGAAFDAVETSEIRSFVPNVPNQLLAARAALTQAIVAGEIDFSTACQLNYNRVVRDTALMADAMGSLATTWYEPLHK